MHLFNRAGECAMCPRTFTSRSAEIGQGLNADDICSNCQAKIDRADPHGFQLAAQLEAAGSHLGAC